MNNKMLEMYVEIKVGEGFTEMVELFQEILDTLPDYQVLERQRFIERFNGLIDKVVGVEE